jgi:transposase
VNVNVPVPVPVPVPEKSKKGLSMAAEVCSMGRPAWLDGSWTSGSGRRFERCSALELYKARSTIECTFTLIKRARRFATRYDKTLRNYQAVLALGCALLWLRI